MWPSGSIILTIKMKPQPSNPEHKRMKREKKTIAYMVDIYCRGHHETHGELCVECKQFQDYAYMRLDKCPFQDKKTTCGKCVIHCRLGRLCVTRVHDFSFIIQV